MNLDEVVNSISDRDADLRHQLELWMAQWKQSTDSLEELVYLMGKWHGNVWFKETTASDAFYCNWLAFKASAIQGIDSMTVNERLHAFGLASLWTKSDERSKSKLRAKLMLPA